MTRRARPRSRRGAVGLAMIVVLVILQLVIVGAVLTGARDQDMTVQRVSSARAFYAAESGVNMALMELMTGNDADGDGTIGAVSNNNNTSDDPAISGGQVYAACTTSSGNYYVTAIGRSASSRHQITYTFVPDGNSGFPRRAVFCSWPNAIPQTRTWSGTAWSAAADTTTLTAKQFWAVMKRSTKRPEMIAGYTTQGGNLEVTTLYKSTWAAKQTFGSGLGTSSERPYYVAYEQSTGKGMVAYRSGSAATIYYQTYNGSTWSGQLSTSSPLSGSPKFIKLIPKVGSAEIMLLVLDDNNDLAAMVWDGSAWGNKTTLETSAASSTCECMDAIYEGGSGRCVAVWGQSGNALPQYRIWTGSAWLAAATAPSIGASPLWVHLSYDSVSSKIMAGFLDSASDISVNVWSGSAWGSNLKVETDAVTTSSRCFDVAFEGSGTSGVIAWGASSSTPRYRIFDGTNWGSQQNAPAISGNPLIIQLSPDATGAEILGLFVCSGGQSSLDFLRFTGTTFDSHTMLESNVSGPSPAEVFMIPDQPPGISHSNGVKSWTEAAPQ